MKTLKFPITIVDDFFDNPDEGRKFAQSLDYEKDLENRWPGSRTKPLHEISPIFYEKVMYRYLNIYYDTHQKNVNWCASMFFQKVDKSYNSGWVHSDIGCIVSNIVYLDKLSDPNTGTTIYEPKDYINVTFKNNEQKKKFFAGKIDNDEKFRNENNKQFRESVIIKNRYK